MCPAYSPPRMHTSRTWEEARVRIAWVLLHCPFDWSIFWRIITGALIGSSPKIWTFLQILQILLWFHAICIFKGCIQICKTSETFSTILTHAANHPQNILHASPPSPNVLSCVHICISALLNSIHIMQNIHQTFANIQLIIQAFIQHFIHITPRSSYIYIAKIMHRHMLQYSSAPINLPFLFTTLKFSIKYGSIAKDSYSPPPFSKINTWFSFNFTWLIYILFLSPFAFLLCFMFWIFLLSFIPFRLLFLNIFEYLYIHVFVV